MEEFLKRYLEKHFIEEGFKNVDVKVWTELDSEGETYYEDPDLNYKTYAKIVYKGLEVIDWNYAQVLLCEDNRIPFSVENLINRMKKKVEEEAVRIFMKD